MVYLNQEMAVISTIYANTRDRSSNSLDHDIVFTLNGIYEHIEHIQEESKYAIMDLFSHDALREYIKGNTYLFERAFTADPLDYCFRVRVENLGLRETDYADTSEFGIAVCGKLMEVLDPTTNYPKAVFKALGLFEILIGSKKICVTGQTDKEKPKGRYNFMEVVLTQVEPQDYTTRGRKN